MFRPPVGSGRGDEDESGRRRHSSRVKFLPLAWAGMPKTSFRKNSDSPHDPRLTGEASEVYRRAGRYYKSLTLTTRVRDLKVKLKQRLAIYLALKRYEQAANMKKSLYRSGLLEDENIRYALAYAYFSSGQFDAASRQIDFLKEVELFKKGVELRRMMANCSDEPWQCT